MIAKWIADKRLLICGQCDLSTQCCVQFEIADAAPPCPLGKLLSADAEIEARAWPQGVAQASGCCDSAINYL